MVPVQESPEHNIGRKIESIRKLKNIKQDTVAKALGMTRQGYSKIEQADTVEAGKLTVIAETLGVPVEAIKNFNEISAIHNNIYDQNNTVINYNFNPIEKIVELYDSLLKSEREKNALLEQLLNKDK